MNAPAHPASVPFACAGAQLCIGEMPLERLALRVGRTPFYAYDRRMISERVALLRSNLPPDVLIHYAVKANPMPAVVQHLASLVDGFDVASGGELRTVLDTTMPVDDISFAGPGKTEPELRSAIAAGIVINVESEHELATIARLGVAAGLEPKVAIRVNPEFELKSSGMKMGGGPKQFGIDAEEVPRILRSMSGLPVAFRGFHIFTGSQNLSAAAIAEAQEKALGLALRLAEFAPCQPAFINLGGGFGIPYFPGERALDIGFVGANLGKLVGVLRDALPACRAVIELGRYIVGEAGVFVCRVIDRKISRGQVFLVTDGGLHHHLAASGNFGQVLRKNYPVLIGNRMNSSMQEVASVVGPLCTPLDLLADRVLLPRAEVGDLVVLLQSGAYGLTASPSAFLSHPGALEVLV